MKKNTKRIIDKGRQAHKLYHLTRPPRLEGKTKNAMTNPKRKKARH